MAASPTPLPLGRVTALQFATTFVNLAMPSTAGRVAVNIRFFQRAGTSPGTAVAVGALDGFAGFIVQITLMLSILLLGLSTIDLNISTSSATGSDRGPIVIAIVIAVIVGAVVLVVVRRLREWVMSTLRDIWTTANSLRSP